ncbi:MAG: hypothetical protein KIS72_03315 [Luteimonas sp.]|nr:hypothetical protein [Luteimonas sp.]
MLMFAAIDLSLSMAIAVLRFQHNLITGHRLTQPGWTPLGRKPEHPLGKPPTNEEGD